MFAVTAFFAAMRHTKFRLWLKATVNSACGNVPLQVPPLERFEISGRWRNGGVIESDNLICGGHGEVLWGC